MVVKMDSTQEILIKAKTTKDKMNAFGEADINRALEAMAKKLVAASEIILSENKKDTLEAQKTLSSVMIDRLTLNEERILGMASGIRELIDLPHPTGRTLSETTRPN